MIVFFNMMQLRRIFRFKAQRRWPRSSSPGGFLARLGDYTPPHDAFTALLHATHYLEQVQRLTRHILGRIAQQV
jgi:hypothetical protein